VENENEKCVLTIDRFYDDMESFDSLSVGAEAIADSVEDGLQKRAVKRKIRRGLEVVPLALLVHVSLQSLSPTI
jgi:hypothetical protein